MINYIEKNPRWRITVTLEKGDDYTFISNIGNRENAILEVSRSMEILFPNDKIIFVQSNDFYPFNGDRNEN
jgi:hypothetical protein